MNALPKDIKLLIDWYLWKERIRACNDEYHKIIIFDKTDQSLYVNYNYLLEGQFYFNHRPMLNLTRYRNSYDNTIFTEVWRLKECCPGSNKYRPQRRHVFLPINY